MKFEVLKESSFYNMSFSFMSFNKNFHKCNYLWMFSSTQKYLGIIFWIYIYFSFLIKKLIFKINLYLH